MSGADPTSEVPADLDPNPADFLRLDLQAEHQARYQRVREAKIHGLRPVFSNNGPRPRRIEGYQVLTNKKGTAP